MKEKATARVGLLGKLFFVVCLFFVQAESAHALTFSAATNYAAGSSTYGGTFADFNGDGNQDIVVTNQSGTGLSVFLGAGNGTFAAAVLYATGNHPTAVIVSDFNSDLKQDIVTINNGNNTYSLLLGNGDGTFGSASTHAVGNGPFWGAAADINSDGKMDVVTANQFGLNNISVLIGNGDGTFAAETNYAAGTGAISITAGDLNNDSKIDLVVSNITSNNVSVLLGNGDGTFATKVNYTANSGVISATIADVNGDSIPDLAVANVTSNDISILIGTGTGTFGSAANFSTGASSSPECVVVGDFNGDGFVDLATANDGNNKMGVLLGNGDGTFNAVTQYTTGSGPQVVFTADFNGDAHKDLVAVNTTDGNISVFLNQYTFPLHHFSFNAISTQTATVALPVTITAKDITNQTVPGYVGTVDFLTTAGTASPATSSSFVSGVLTSQSITLSGTGTSQTITATDHGGTKTGTSAVFTVLPIAVVTSVTSSQANGSYGAGVTIPVQLIFNTPVTVTGTPTVVLSTGAPTTVSNYVSGSGTSTLVFNYTISAGENISLLDYATTGSLSLAGGTIKNAAAYDAVLTLPTPGTTGSLSNTKQLVVDTTPPVVTESIAVTPMTFNTRPPVSISSTETGTISYGGSCVSGAINAFVGVTLITFSTLLYGVHDDCTIRVTDVAGNMSTSLLLTPFTVLSQSGHSRIMPVEISPSAQSFIFKNVLQSGVRSSDVRELQKYLNAHGFIVAKNGAGSSGNETNFFGAATRFGLIAYQEAHAAEILAPLNLTKGTGKLGLSTIAYINSHR